MQGRVHHGLPEAEQLLQPWRELYEQVPAATPFTSPEWALSWLRLYAGSARAVVVSVWQGDRLVALAPLYRRRAGPLRVLGLAGEGISDYLDVLVHPEVITDAEVWAALRSTLQSVPRWDVLDLRQLSPHSGAVRLEHGWGSPSLRRKDTACSALNLTGVEELTDLAAGRSGATRKKLRYLQRRAAAAGATVRVVNPVTPDDVRRLLDVHQRRWEGRQITPEHTSARYAEHLERVIPDLAARDEAVLYEVVAGDQLIAARLLLSRPGWLGDYLYGLEGWAVEDKAIDLNVVLMDSVLAIARDREVVTLDFLRGDYPHKARWRPTPLPTLRLSLGRTTLAWSVYRGGVAARRAAVRLARRRASPVDADQA